MRADMTSRRLPKKLLVGVGLLGIVSLAALVVVLAPKAAAETRPVVYFTPHQDDETISMGSDIVASVAANRPVYVVLATDGRASGARNLICQKTGHCLSYTQFSEARNKEMRAALDKLGVPSSHIFYEGYHDSELTPQQAETIIDKYIARFPTASFKTISWLDKSKDHYLLGYALNNRCVNQRISDCRFLQSPLYQTGSSIATSPVVTPLSGQYNDINKVRAAVDEYRYWNPSQGRYAIGQYSVKSQLEYTYKNHYSLYHLANNRWRSEADRQAASKWIEANQQPF